MYLEHIFCDGLNAQYSFILTITKKIFTSPLLKQPFLLFISVVPFCNVVSNLPHHLNRKTGQVFESEPTVRHCHLNHQLRVCMGALMSKKSLCMGSRGGSLSQMTVEKEEMLNLCPCSLGYSSVAKKVPLCPVGHQAQPPWAVTVHSALPWCGPTSHPVCTLGASREEGHQTVRLSRGESPRQ